VPLPAALCDDLRRHRYSRDHYASVVPQEIQFRRVLRWIDFSDAAANQTALTRFDQCVLEITCCHAVEHSAGTLDIWHADGVDQMCNTCDQRTTCYRQRGTRHIRSDITAP
jgi:hypothetical protein